MNIVIGVLEQCSHALDQVKVFTRPDDVLTSHAVEHLHISNISQIAFKNTAVAFYRVIFKPVHSASIMNEKHSLDRYYGHILPAD